VRDQGSGVVDLFVYGTLMDDALVVQLTGRRFFKVSARLEGYRKYLFAGSYAQIRPEPGAYVEGCLLQNVDCEALRAFDDYEDEGRMYRRTAVTVLVRGLPCPAVTYVGLRPLPKNCA
jgi:gamma-glutamylcyclotransferase (GGCT)/AIG2-like uncharacterized protein YtfP